MALSKYEARRNILARRRKLSETEQHDAAKSVSLHTFDDLTANDVVALYFPIKGELPTNFIATEVAKTGAKIVYPYALANGSMEFRLKTPELVEDDLGILSPTGAVLEPNVIFTPLVAFDRQGNRIGYGKGYYDKALATLALESSQPIRTIGLAYSWQELEDLPTAKHDIPLDQIWTEKEVITCQKLQKNR